MYVHGAQTIDFPTGFNCVRRQGKPAAAMLEKPALKESMAGHDTESTHTPRTNSDNDEMEQETDATKDSVRGSDVTTDGGHERTHGERAHHSKHRAKQHTVEGPELPDAGDMFYGPHLPTGDDVVCGPSDAVEGPHWPSDSVPSGPQMAETAAEKHGHVVKEHRVDRSGSSSKTSSHSDAGSKGGAQAEERFVRHKHLAEQDPSTEAGGHRATVKHVKETEVPEDSVADEPVVKAQDGEDDIEEDDDDDFDDMDMDIDKQLELALEKKKVSDAYSVYSVSHGPWG